MISSISPRMPANIPDPLQWAEGMLLTPQHMQQYDQYWHSIGRQQMAVSQPFYWGLIAMRFDRDMLKKGQVIIQRLDAVMPDGFLLHYDQTQWGDSLTIDLATLSDIAPGQRIRVHAAIPVGGVVEEGQVIPRFDAIMPTLAPDENTGKNEVEIFRKRPKLSLMVNNKTARHVLLPLMEVIYQSNGQFELSAYHPPALRVRAWSFLGRRSLADQGQFMARRLREKAETLAETGAASRKGSGGMDVQLALAAMVSELPRLEALTKSDETHPRDLFMLLTGLSGRLAAIIPGQIPAQPGEYRHDDCLPSLANLMQDVNRILADVQLNYRCLPFEVVADGVFRRILSDIDMDGPLLLELKPKRGQSRDAARRWLAGTRIGRAGLIHALRRIRASGANVRRIGQEERDSLELPVSGLLVEVRQQTIECEGQLENVMAADEPLVIDGDGQGAPEEIVLYRRRPSDGG